ncbi:MAG TPA: GNAT family N-acetyltransferase [Rhodanobacteraceae bacterium]|nr:GNAT family N-acetyltransferase [Rhodanobacteraceae bacterium]
MSATTAAQVQATILTQPSEIEAIAPQWDALFARCPHAAVALTPTWMLAWWASYGSAYANGVGALRVICVHRGDALIGVLPLYRRRNMARIGPSPHEWLLLSSGEAEHEESCTEYLDLLCRDEDGGDCVAAVATCLQRWPWQRIALRLLDRRTALAGLSGALADFALVRIRDAGVCPIADLSGGMEAYLARLSSSARYRMRRALREADSDALRFHVASADEAVGALDELGRLHQQHWVEAGSPGCFAAPRWVDFHRRLLATLYPQGRAVIATLYASDQAVAAIYGFLAHGSFHYYQTGVSRESIPGVRSPGILANLLLMRHLAEHGVTSYDFLRGQSRYKRELSTREGGLVDIEIWRKSAVARSWMRLYPGWLRVLRKLRLIRV